MSVLSVAPISYENSITKKELPLNIFQGKFPIAIKREVSIRIYNISEIPDDIFEKMQGKSYKENCTVPREELRYIHILHIGFDGKTHEGELIVNKRIADAVLDIFAELYKAEYRIEKVRLIDE